MAPRLRATPSDFNKSNVYFQFQANRSNFIRKRRIFKSHSRISINGENIRSSGVIRFYAFIAVFTHFRFQKRLQMNLLQLVDSVSSQFQSTKENPNSFTSSASNFLISQAASKNSSSHENMPNQETQESATRRKRSSFTDMPKI